MVPVQQIRSHHALFILQKEQLSQPAVLRTVAKMWSLVLLAIFGPFARCVRWPAMYAVRRELACAHNLFFVNRCCLPIHLWAYRGLAPFPNGRLWETRNKSIHLFLWSRSDVDLVRVCYINILVVSVSEATAPICVVYMYVYIYLHTYMYVCMYAAHCGLCAASLYYFSVLSACMGTVQYLTLVHENMHRTSTDFVSCAESETAAHAKAHYMHSYVCGESEVAHSGIHHMHNDNSLACRVGDKLVWSKVRDGLGGRMKVIPLDACKPTIFVCMYVCVHAHIYTHSLDNLNMLASIRHLLPYILLSCRVSKSA